MNCMFINSKTVLLILFKISSIFFRYLFSVDKWFFHGYVGKLKSVVLLVKTLFLKTLKVLYSPRPSNIIGCVFFNPNSIEFENI